MKKRHNKKTSTKLRLAIATAQIRQDPQDPAGDLQPWQVAMLRRVMNSSPATAVRCGPKPLSLKASKSPKQVPDPTAGTEPDTSTMDDISAQLLRLRDEIALARHSGISLDDALQNEETAASLTEP